MLTPSIDFYLDVFRLSQNVKLKSAQSNFLILNVYTVSARENTFSFLKNLASLKIPLDGGE
jgi:hypothetical protein